MQRQPPSVPRSTIELYVRTYYSLLRSTGEVQVRAFEEAHAYSESTLHTGARSVTPDVAAFAYAAARLPDCMTRVTRVVLGQSHEQFEAAGIPVRQWTRVRARGRRRAMYDSGGDVLAVFVTSASDIDDLVPILTAFQIEWNKMHARLRDSNVAHIVPGGSELVDPRALGEALGLPDGGVWTLMSALGPGAGDDLRRIAARALSLSVRLLSGSFSQYQRASQRWWSGVERMYVREEHPRRRPVYVVSSNTHSLPNLLCGYARAHREEIAEFARRRNPEGLAADLDRATAAGDDAEVSNIIYYLLRAFLHDPEGDHDGRRAEVQRFDAESGMRSVESPGHVDVGAQVFDLARLRPDRFDPRVRLDGLDVLARSDAVVLNLDYPLGMAAFHHLSRLVQGVGELRGLYVMGKAATLNGRVGDVMVSSVVHDEHSANTYLFRNAFSAPDVQPWLAHATVLDNQKALTVRSAFLQSESYMAEFYRDGYTVLEMEAGPYLSALFEVVYPVRHPENEIVHLSNATPFDVGILHYASDTPYSRRQSLLSKSLSYFGVESTYACAIAILRRIFEAERTRLAGAP